MKKKNSILFLFCLTAVFAALFSGCVKVEVSDTKTDSDEQNVSFSELILSRRSIRSYQPQPVEREKMEEIVKCGIYAPSALNRQSWEVRIVDNPEFINGVTELFKKENPAAADNPNFKNMFVNAPTVAFIANDTEFPYSVLDCGLLGENMMLAAWSMGIGSCCLGGATAFLNSEAAASLSVIPMKRLPLLLGSRKKCGLSTDILKRGGARRFQRFRHCVLATHTSV